MNSNIDEISWASNSKAIRGNAFLSCLHGHLDNRLADLSEQLYLVTKLKRYEIEPIYNKMIAEPHLPPHLRAMLILDGMPTRQEVREWLSSYGENYPNWDRAKPLRSCVLPIIAFIIGLSIIVFGRSQLGFFAWILGSLVILSSPAIASRYISGAWLQTKAKHVRRSLDTESLRNSVGIFRGDTGFDEFAINWILSKQFDGDPRSNEELVREARLIWLRQL